MKFRLGSFFVATDFFVSTLGLRIAPPEAPVTGYMFGKGIYFADMVSKSANYCATTPSNPYGLMLLCDVALGNVSKIYNVNSNLNFFFVKSFYF